MTMQRSRTFRPLLLSLVAAAMTLVGCSASTLVTLNVEALQFIDEADRTTTFQTSDTTINEVLPDADGVNLDTLGLGSDVIGSLAGLSLDVGLNLSSAAVSTEMVDSTRQQSAALSLAVTIYVAEAGTASVTDGVVVGDANLTLPSVGDEDTLDLSVELSETENVAAFELLEQGASLGIEIEATADLNGDPVSVTATITKLDLGISTSLSSVLNQ